MKINAFQVDPYVRYTVATAGPVSFFLNGGFGFATEKAKAGDWKSDSYNAWQIGIKPGIKVSLSKKVDFIATMGFLGYRDNDDITDSHLEDLQESVYGEKGFGFSFSTNDLNFGLIYNF